jgi:hypothetical protein
VFNATANNISRVLGSGYDKIEDTWMHQKLIDFDNLPAKVYITKAVNNVSTYGCACVTEFPAFKKYFFEGYVTESESSTSPRVPVQRDLCLKRSYDDFTEDTTNLN